ncbi:phosphopantetheine-binding protein [Actinospica robiniae]|uniref:phosphopantetheine-binding protein n=1 Tax=Actinospica robiniae TaxID=304901 RepID=UPI00040835B3|nr:phosphopantetheine-binding protein [Actinospica robiniae]
MTTTSGQTVERGAVLAAISAAVQAALRMSTDVAVTESTHLVDELGLDSSQIFGLLLELEESLAIELDTDSLRLGDLVSAGSLADFVSRCRPA